MKFTEFISDRTGRLMMDIVLTVAAALFLRAAGTQAGVIILLLIPLSIVFALTQIYDFIRQRTSI